MKHNNLNLARRLLALLLVVCSLLTFAACGEEEAAPTNTDTTPGAAGEVAVTVKNSLDAPLEGVQVYVYTDDTQTDIENLYAAGEVVGGIHGRNRLMGNSLLDIIVFGRNAGKYASEKAKSVTPGQLNLSHVADFEQLRENAGVSGETVSPKLLPDYTRKVK